MSSGPEKENEMNTHADRPDDPGRRDRGDARQPRPTLRAVSEGMEAHLYTPKPVLDHGFVRVIDYMGDDAAIVQAARVSYGRGRRRRGTIRG
jgi:thymidylate synthase (FAD)